MGDRDYTDLNFSQRLPYLYGDGSWGATLDLSFTDENKPNGKCGMVIITITIQRQHYILKPKNSFGNHHYYDRNLWYKDPEETNTGNPERDQLINIYKHYSELKRNKYFEGPYWAAQPLYGLKNRYSDFRSDFNLHYHSSISPGRLSWYQFEQFKNQSEIQKSLRDIVLYTPRIYSGNNRNSAIYPDTMQSYFNYDTSKEYLLSAAENEKAVNFFNFPELNLDAYITYQFQNLIPESSVSEAHKAAHIAYQTWINDHNTVKNLNYLMNYHDSIYVYSNDDEPETNLITTAMTNPKWKLHIIQIHQVWIRLIETQIWILNPGIQIIGKQIGMILF